MSRCDEYREKLLEVEGEIEKLTPRYYDDLTPSQRRRLELKKQEREVLKDRYERSRKRGGC